MEGSVRNSKPYTNAYFTKRVDHDGGRHHAPRRPAEPLICEECGAVYVRRRWTAPLAPDKQEIPLSAKTRAVRCPSCRQRRNGLPCGFVHVAGPFLAQHQEEIEHLLT